jgi:hypothetical protein
VRGCLAQSRWVPRSCQAKRVGLCLARMRWRVGPRIETSANPCQASARADGWEHAEHEDRLTTATSLLGERRLEIELFGEFDPGSG